MSLRASPPGFPLERKEKLPAKPRASVGWMVNQMKPHFIPVEGRGSVFLITAQWPQEAAQSLHRDSMLCKLVYDVDRVKAWGREGAREWGESLPQAQATQRGHVSTYTLVSFFLLSLPQPAHRTKSSSRLDFLSPLHLGCWYLGNFWTTPPTPTHNLFLDDLTPACGST